MSTGERSLEVSQPSDECFDATEYESLLREAQNAFSSRMAGGVALVAAGALGLWAKDSKMFSPRQSFYLGVASYGALGYGALKTAPAVLARTGLGAETYTRVIRLRACAFFQTAREIKNLKEQGSESSGKGALGELQTKREELKEHYDFLRRISDRAIENKIAKVYNEAVAD